MSALKLNEIKNDQVVYVADKYSSEALVWYWDGAEHQVKAAELGIVYDNKEDADNHISEMFQALDGNWA